MRALRLALLLALSTSLPAASDTSFAAALGEPLRRARAQASDLGVHIVDLESGTEIVAHNADRPLVVASNTKLITTAAALELLGPGFFYETKLLLRGTLRGDVLVGDLAVIGSGDPTFSGRHYAGDPAAVFRDWAQTLRDIGVRRVAGDVLLYHGAWDDRRIHPDWPRNQLSRCYEAPVDALVFNDNCVRVTVTAGTRSGAPARVEISPDLGLLTVRNEAVTVASLRRHRVLVDREPGTDEIVVGGRVYRRARPFDTWVTVPDPAAYFGSALARTLTEEGVVIEGGARPVDALPHGPWWPYETHRSSLLTTLTVINTASQNLYAEVLVKTLGRELCGEGNWSAGLSILRDFLFASGVARGGFRLADGSGMSRENRFSPRALTRLLRYMNAHELAKEYRATLPVSGVETHHRWRQRLAREPYRGRVVAKTGSLAGVSALSGYALGLSGREYAFSIVANGVPSVWQARRAQDRILRALIDAG